VLVSVWTTRSGRVLHASSSCPKLDGRRVLKLKQEDALPGSTDCMEPLCRMARARREDKAA
jgi:hypothetical protein